MLVRVKFEVLEYANAGKMYVRLNKLLEEVDCLKVLGVTSSW